MNAPDAPSARRFAPAGSEAASLALDDFSAERSGREWREYLAILRRHKLQIVLVSLLITMAGVAVALLLPSVYQSSATILVQEQEVPPDLVRSTITSFADERIQVINQQVMTRAVLLGLIEQFDLYPDYRRYATEDQLLARIDKDIGLTTVDSSISDRTSGRRVNATIAFKISFSAPDPRQAQRVVEELVRLYLNENVLARQQSAAETSAFLAQESKRAAARIREIEANLAEFKRRNAGRTPDSSALNLQLAERTDGELMRVERELVLVQDRRAAMEVQLAALEPNLPAPSLPGVPESRQLSPADRLRSLEGQYAANGAIYRADHPDLRKLEREIAALRTELGAAAADGASDRLTQLETELVDLRRRYADDHPDVQRVRRAIAGMKATGATTAPASPKPVSRLPAARPDNPAYITLAAQLDAAKREIVHLSAMRDDLRAKQRTYDARLAQIPEVEREYRELTRDYENAQERYRDIRAKEMQAQVALELEKEQKAERFAIGEPANLPQTPIWPRRLQIALAGFVASIAVGVGIAWLRDVVDPSVKGPLELRRLAPVPLLTPIPYIATRRERVESRVRKAMGAALVAVVLVASLAALDRYWKPLPRIAQDVVHRLPL